MNETGNDWEEEQREFFRIDDEVYLQLKPLSDEEARQWAEHPDNGEDDPRELVLYLQDLNSQSANILAGIRKTQPEIAQYLALQEKKLDRIARSLVGSALHIETKPNTAINLSAGGLRLDYELQLDIGTLLDVQLMLFPNQIFIHLLGKVSHCETNEDDSLPPYRLGIAFARISDTAREALVRHTLELQSARLREARASTNEE